MNTVSFFINKKRKGCKSSSHSLSNYMFRDTILVDFSQKMLVATSTMYCTPTKGFGRFFLDIELRQRKTIICSGNEKKR
jgi:hypothetical protein